MKRMLILLVLLVCVGCAVQEAAYLRAPDRADLNQSKDEVECLALASQAAQGAGSFTSAAPYAAAIYDGVKTRYFVQCMQSRGYTLVTPR